MRHKFEEMKEMLSEELDKLTAKQDLTLGGLETIDKLTHSIKSLATIVAMEEGGSSATGSSRRRNYRTSYEGYDMGGSQRRRRDSMGRYSSESSEEDVVNELRTLMMDAPPEMQRKMRDFITEIEG